MANNYLQFSEALGNLTIAEHDWLQRQLETVYVFGDTEYAKNEVPEQLSTADATWRGNRAFQDLPGVDSDDDAGFQCEFRQVEELGRHLWIYAEESGDAHRVAHLVQKFLRQFRPHESWSLTYATTCSKPRLGEFAGGGGIRHGRECRAFPRRGFLNER